MIVYTLLAFLFFFILCSGLYLVIITWVNSKEKNEDFETQREVISTRFVTHDEPE